MCDEDARPCAVEQRRIDILHEFRLCLRIQRRRLHNDNDSYQHLPQISGVSNNATYRFIEE